MTNKETTIDPINQDALKACSGRYSEPEGYSFNTWYDTRGKYQDFSEFDDIFEGLANERQRESNAKTDEG